jgi:hypothetical protein
MDTSILALLQNTARDQNLRLDDEVITDTIDLFGARELIIILRMIMNSSSPELDAILGNAMGDFFNVAKDKQMQRDQWNLMMEGKLVGGVNSKGEIVFKESM